MSRNNVKFIWYETDQMALGIHICTKHVVSDVHLTVDTVSTNGDVARGEKAKGLDEAVTVLVSSSACCHLETSAISSLARGTTDEPSWSLSRCRVCGKT